MENPSKTPEMTDTQGEVPLYTQQTSIEEPPLLGIATPLPTQTRDIEKQTLAVEPFRPVLEVLKQIEGEDTELAFRAARLVGCIRCLWESCVSKHTDIQQLEEENEKLRSGNIQLCNEGNHLRLFEPWFHDKCQILIIGPDTVRLSDRIFKSEDYYKGKPSHQTQLEVCIFAIPDNFEKSVEEIRRLRHCYHALSLFSRRERIEALITGEELLENNLIRQIKSIEPSPCKVSGEYLDVKVFDLFGSSTHRYLQPHLIGLEFAGMEFGIEWNVKDPMSKDDCWKARQGIPYIEAASSRDIKVAVKDRSRRRKPQSLVFHSEYPDWDPQTTVSIPISSV